MRLLAALFVLLAAPAGAQVPPPTTVPAPAPWAPTAPYVIVGQDEPGYRNWYIAAPWHAS